MGLEHFEKSQNHDKKFVPDVVDLQLRVHRYAHNTFVEFTA